ncbi:MAG TPA: DUF512 domain-containing protein [Bacteroidetes bacterium]|nr:DUF512 domain-containing protein [Bacteroidota bacterium]
MKIETVAPDSIAAELDIRPGDSLIRINGHFIRDEIDFRFYAGEEMVELLVGRDSGQVLFEIEKEPDDLLGIRLKEFPMRACGNHCVFCFTDQNPAGLRKSLYFKDEDYRLSFLYGQYTTLTNTSWKDLKRIVTQRLSPLYISVHATDWEVRKYLFGLKRRDRLPEKLQFLADHGIQLHTQIVLCPGVNDGAQLTKTVHDLSRFFPAVASIAIVPVGLTKHRGKLPFLNPVIIADARRILEQVDQFQCKFRSMFGSGFVFPSDEFYIIAGREIPGADYYEGYPQIEDGVGIIRYLLAAFREIIPQLPERIPEEHSATFLSGLNAAPFLKKEIIPALDKIENLHTRVVPVKNRFYGETITVTGLLTGQDYAQAIRQNGVTNTALISSKCVNRDGLFLDDWTVEKLAEETGCAVVLMDDFLTGLPDFIKEI